jgi:predicted ABC-type ATPase
VYDYEQRANLKANAFIKEKLWLGADFGVELNLGSDSHYDFIRWVRNHYAHYQINVILFFTDDLQICLVRALLREQAGGHLVEAEIVRRMYDSTLWLLRENIKMVNHLQFINVTYDINRLVYSGYYPTAKLDFIEADLPNWVITKFPELK